MTKILYNGSELHAALSNGSLDINDLQPSDYEVLGGWIEDIIRERDYNAEMYDDECRDRDSLEDRYEEDLEELRDEISRLESDRDELDDRVRELEDELENYCEGN